MLDEVAGQWFALVPIAFMGRGGDWRPYGMAFFLFRVFDILKALADRSAAERLPGGFGVMMDDVLAGIAAAYSSLRHARDRIGVMFSAAITNLAIALLIKHTRDGLHVVTIVVAESCTGGLIAAALTEIAGSSDVVDRGFSPSSTPIAPRSNCSAFSPN